MKVYKAIENVMRDLGAEGIGKNKRAQNYNFRGIDDVLNALNPLMAKHGLVIIPRVITRETVERQAKSGGALFYTFIHAEFDFVSTEDGSKHTASTIGEAMDSSDKSSNKAMSAAYKYAAFQTFCIPTEAVDGDFESHEVKPLGSTKSPATSEPRKPSTAARPNKPSPGQLTSMFNKLRAEGKTPDDLKTFISAWGLKETKELNYKQYEDVLKWIAIKKPTPFDDLPDFPVPKQ